MYRLNSDSLNIIIEKRHIVDPTKSPRWKEGMSTTIREEYRPVSYHHSLENALKYLQIQLIKENIDQPIQLDEIMQFLHKIHGDLASYVQSNTIPSKGVKNV